MNALHVSPFLSYALNHLWQSTLFATLAWLVTITLFRQNRAQVRYAVWLAASFKFLIPFSALVSLGSRVGWLRLAPPATQVKVYFAVDEVSRQPAPRLITTALLPIVPAPAIHLSDILLVIWACGIAVVVIRWFLAWRGVHLATAGATPLRTFDGIQVLSSPALRERGLEPGVFGLFNAVVLVPEGITDRLTPEQFAAVLTHECCHARRRDNLAAALHMLVEAAFWFHPLVWWLGQRMMQERERACDEDVLRRHNDPEIYAEGILNVCKFYLESPMQCVAGITGADLKHRIADIMTRRRSHDLDSLRKAFLTLAGMAAVAGPFALGLLQTPVTHAQTMSSFDGVIKTTTAKEFEVATVKQNLSGDPGWRLGPPGHGSVSIVNLQLKKILASAFNIQDSMVFGPPSLDSDRYDIVGKGPDPKATNPEVWEMMRSLLIERFNLRFHVESRSLPVYALIVAKGGPRLKRPEDGPCAEAIQAHLTCGDIGYPAFGVSIVNMPVGALRSALARKLQDRPIVDKTGITGNYDAAVRWLPDDITPDALANIPPQDRPEDVSLFTALERQAGLRLEARKENVQVLVVDSLERLTEKVGSIAPPAFDAATIRPNISASPDVDFTSPAGGRFIARNVNLKMLLMRAYKAKNFEIAGGASWIDSSRLDITAIAPHDAPPPDPVADQPPPTLCGGFNMDGAHFEGRKISMPLFASDISNMLGRPVIDNTGYAGTFDVHLAFAPEGIAALSGGGFDTPRLAASASDSANPTLFTSIEHQMGLKLESQKVPAEILMIDRAAKPSGD
jgi:bla regulator protein blaR1